MIGWRIIYTLGGAMLGLVACTSNYLLAKLLHLDLVGQYQGFIVSLFAYVAWTKSKTT